MPECSKMKHVTISSLMITPTNWNTPLFACWEHTLPKVHHLPERKQPLPGNIIKPETERDKLTHHLKVIAARPEEWSERDISYCEPTTNCTTTPTRAIHFPTDRARRMRGTMTVVPPLTARNSYIYFVIHVFPRWAIPDLTTLLPSHPPQVW